MTHAVQPFYRNPQYGLKYNPSITKDWKNFLSEIFSLLEESTVRNLTDFRTAEKQISNLQEHMYSFDKMNRLVSSVVFRYFQENERALQKARSFGELQVSINSLIRPFQGCLAFALQQRLTDLTPAEKPLDDFSYLPICKRAIDETYNHPSLRWFIDELPVKLSNKREFVARPEAKDDFILCIQGEQSIDQLRSKLSDRQPVQTSCDGYIGLILLLMSNDPSQVIDLFRERMNTSCIEMKKVLDEKGPNMNERLNLKFHEVFHGYLKQAEEVSDISIIEPGRIVVFGLKKQELYQFLHVALCLDPGRTIGLWHYPPNRVTGKSSTGAQIMRSEDAIKILADDFQISVEEIIVRELDINAFMKQS